MSNDKGGGYLRRPWIYGLVVVAMWGLVPTLAKAADFPGGFTTFWVNVFSALGVLAIMIATGQLKQFQEFRLIPRFFALSLVWPLAYSIAYFSVIKESSGSLATLMNYMWPLFALLMLSRTMKIPRIGLVLTAAGFLLVAGTLYLEGNLNMMLGPMLIGLVAPLTQAYFNVTTTDEATYPGEYAWLLTFVGAIVTALGSALYVLVQENGQFTNGVSLSDLLPLAIIGVGGNSIGFYAFLRAGQMSKTPTAKVWFILTMFSIPFVQVLLLVLRIEPGIPITRLIGIGIVSLGFLVFKVWELRQRMSNTTS